MIHITVYRETIDHLAFETVEEAATYFEITAPIDSFESFVQILNYTIADRGLPWALSVHRTESPEDEEEDVEEPPAAEETEEVTID